jgi:hypothetical protein
MSSPWQILRALLRSAPGLLCLGCITTSGCNDCDFTEKRCNGNVVEECGGTDQFIGRSISRTPCEGLNPRCVETAEEQAFCATSAETHCTPPASRCDGNIQLACHGGFEVAQDCTKVKIFVTGQGPVPADYVCNAPAGATAACRKPN